MTFTEAEQQLLLLRERRHLGQLPDAEYIEAVNALRVIDDEQAWWQPDPYSDGWLRWDGAAWQPATPPPRAEQAETTAIVEDADLAESPAAAEEAAPAEVPAAVEGAPEEVTTAEDAVPKYGFSEWAAGVKQQVQAQAADPQTFLRLARSLPLRRRPESWWNALSIFGGAASGYFWFVYGSVSGLPTPGFLLGTPLAKYSRFIVPLALLLIPILMLLFRQRSVTLFARIQRKFGGFSLTKKVVLLIGIPVLLCYFPRIYTVILYRLPFLSRFSFLQLGFGEGVDIITPLMMVGLPVAFIYLRRPIDGFLSRFKLYYIPAPLRIGIGIAMPFLTAYLLFYLKITQYPLLRANVLLGTALSYMMVRTPRLQTPTGKTPLPAPALASMLMCLGLAVLVLLLADPALADCFLTDPFNFNDGLRTPGVAPILAGVATATVSMLVNGVEIARTVIQTSEPVKEGEDPAQRNYSVQVRTVDAKGKPSTQLKEGDPGVIFLYAYCMNESGSFPDGDATITFPTDLGNPGLVIADLGTQYQQRCASISMPSPVQGGIPPTITVTVTAGNGQFSIPVTLQVEVALALNAKMINANQPNNIKREYPVYEAWTPADEKTWTFTELVAFFYTPPNTEDPTTPGFTPIWEAPVISPDYIDLTSLASDDGNLTWRCRAKMKEGVKAPEDWLLNDGVITVTFTGKPEAAPGAPPSSTSYSAKFGLHLPPAVELACPFDTDEQEGREYAGIEMERNQFLCDATDEKELIIFLHNRFDKDSHVSVADNFEMEQLQITFDQTSKSHFTLTEDTDYDEPGRKRYTVKSNEVVLQAPGLPDKITLTMKAKARPKTGDTNQTTDLTGTVILKPGYVFLKFWVVGGGVPGTSEASCFACMTPDWSNPLVGFPLMLKVDTMGSASLTIEGTDRIVTSDEGIAKWVLRYSGLTWETYAGALFHVRCGVPVGNNPPARGTEVTIDIQKNVTELVETIYDRRELELNLVNKNFTSNRFDYIYPDDMSGPWTNIRSLVYSDWDEYICGNLSGRVYNWMARRRLGDNNSADPEPWTCMNGIEVSQFGIWDLGPISHHFAGFYLSGTDILDSPRFIDPWWYQGWSDPKLRSLSGLYTKNSERYLIIKSMTFVAIFALIFAKIAVVAGATRAATLLYALAAGTEGLGILDVAIDVFDYAEKVGDFKNGRYVVYRQHWPENAVKRLKTVTPTVPAVDHLKDW